MMHVGDIMSTVGVIMSTMGVFSTVGVFSTMEGCHPLKFEYRGDIMIHVGGYHEYRGVFSTVRYSNNKRFPPPVLNTLQGTHDIPPRYSRYPPTCIMIPHSTEHPHSTQDNPHGTHDVPHGTEHPTVLKISPNIYHDTPRYSRYPHGTAHTLYRMIYVYNTGDAVSLDHFS